jgi:hypothetical protein
MQMGIYIPKWLLRLFGWKPDPRVALYGRAERTRTLRFGPLEIECHSIEEDDRPRSQ